MNKRTNRKKKTYINTGLSIGIILLFISLALSPGIDAQVNNIDFLKKESSLNSDTVERVVQSSDDKRTKDTTVKHTTQRANELEEPLEDIQSSAYYCIGVLIGTVSNVNRFNDRNYIYFNAKNTYCSAKYVFSDHGFGECEGWIEQGRTISILKQHRLGFQGITIGPLSKHFICIIGHFQIYT